MKLGVWCAALCGVAMTAAVSTAAEAKIYQIAATDFRALEGVNQPRYDRGVLTLRDEIMYAAVPISEPGQVCAFRLIYGKNDKFPISASLIRKNIVPGSNAFSKLDVLATVTSGSKSNKSMQVAETSDIAGRAVDPLAGFLYVSVDFGSTGTYVIGAQVDIRDVCP